MNGGPDIRPGLNVSGSLTVETPKGTVVVTGDGPMVTIDAPTLGAAKQFRDLSPLIEMLPYELRRSAGVTTVVRVKGSTVATMKPSDSSPSIKPFAALKALLGP